MNCLFLRLDPNEKLNLNEQASILLNSTLTSPKTIIKLSTKFYVDNKFNEPSIIIIKNTTHVDFNDENLDNVRFIEVNTFPAFPNHLTAKFFVDKAISYSVDESSLLRLDPNEKLRLDEQDSILLNSTLTSPTTTIMKYLSNHMLIGYTKVVKIDKIYDQCLKIKILKLIIIDELI